MVSAEYHILQVTVRYQLNSAKSCFAAMQNWCQMHAGDIYYPNHCDEMSWMWRVAL